MSARIANPGVLLPGAMEAIQALNTAIEKGGVPASTLALVHIRASQINGCTLCVGSGTSQAGRAGETKQRLGAVAGWRQADCFTLAERAALGLAESVTRLSDQADPVPDEIWDEAARHYDERGLAALVLSLGVTNMFNRLNVTTRQLAPTWG